MNQSNLIFGTLVIAFIIFVTTKGELPTYLALLFGAGGKDKSGGSGGGSGDTMSTVMSVAKLAVLA